MLRMDGRGGGRAGVGLSHLGCRGAPVETTAASIVRHRYPSLVNYPLLALAGHAIGLKGNIRLGFVC